MMAMMTVATTIMLVSDSGDCIEGVKDAKGAKAMIKGHQRGIMLASSGCQLNCYLVIHDFSHECY